MSYNKRLIGGQYENMAAEYLQQQGLTVLARNYRDRYGEIDVIARDGRYLVFIEVKYRSGLKLGSPLEAVSAYKQQRIRNTARFYLYSNRYGDDTPCRFDVVGILNDKIEWIKNAF